MVEGNLCIESFNVHALIDPAASHSFVNPDIVLRLGLIVSSLECLLPFSGRKCDPSITEIIYCAYPVMVEDKCFLADLIVLELIDFDVILGID